MAKQKFLTEEAQLKRAVGNNVVELKDFNDLGAWSPNLAKLRDYFFDLDSQQFCNRYKWLGGPDYIYNWRIEQMLYHRASLAFFKVANRFYLLPYALSDELTPEGLPTGVTPQTYNGGVLKSGGDIPKSADKNFLNFKLAINWSGKYDPSQAQAVLLYDRWNGFITASGLEPRFVLQATVINEMVERFKYLKINLKNSQGKLLIICKDEKQATAIRRAIEDMYSNDSNFELIKSMFDIQVINNDIKFMGQEIWEDVASWNSLRLEGLGLANSGLFNKKERTIEKEIDNSGESKNAILLSGLASRRLFLEQIKQVFGEDPDFKRDFADWRVEIDSDILEMKKQEIPADERKDEESQL